MKKEEKKFEQKNASKMFSVKSPRTMNITIEIPSNIRIFLLCTSFFLGKK